MPQLRSFLLPLAAGAAVAAAVLSAPTAAADPTCETLGGSAVTGGQTTQCSTPGNTQISVSPGIVPNENPMFYGFPGFGII